MDLGLRRKTVSFFRLRQRVCGCRLFKGNGASGELAIVPISGKTKIVSLRLTSIPRLELCDALLAARLFKRTTEGSAEGACFAWMPRSKLDQGASLQMGYLCCQSDGGYPGLDAGGPLILLN